MAETIFLVRHAEAESNEKRYFAGWTDSPLTKLGKEQALLLRKRLSREGFGMAYCSDLVRAKDTLAALALSCPVEYSPKLRERSYGQLEGVAWGEDEGKYSPYHTDSMLRPPGGENYLDLQKRVLAYFESGILPCPKEKVLVVTHHGVIVSLACAMLGMPLEKWRVLRLGNCGLSILAKEGNIWRLTLWNSLSHSGLQSFSPLLKGERRQEKQGSE